MNQLTVNADLGSQTINRHIYGHFAEHLGRCIYGGIYVGADSPIPNTRGMRNDIVAALRHLNIPNLRWPGGCFADEYHWMDGIGPQEGRPTMINTHWGGVTEDNSFGTHEFFELCDQLGCEPYICGNVGSGTVQEMQQWVEYITFDGISPMANLRRENGRDEPWRIKYWGVGNENWGCGGSMRPEYYADEYRRFQTYVRNFGENQIYKIACGPNGDNYHWTETLMARTQNQPGNFLLHGLSLHHYTRGAAWETPNIAATGFPEAEWFKVLQAALHMDELIQRHSTIMDKYDPAKKVALIVDEWGTWYAVEPGTNPGFLYQQNSLRDALVTALHFDIFHRHCARVQMANIAQTINVLQAMILTEDGGDRMVLTPTYHVYEMYKVHQDATLLPLDLTSDDYTFGEATMPALSATASRDAVGIVHLSLSNVDPHLDHTVRCRLHGMDVGGVNGRILTAAHMDAHNTFDEPEVVQPTAFNGASLDGDQLIIQLPAKSVVTLRIEANTN
jgi:alpha-N-arabinofuranosidase